MVSADTKAFKKLQKFLMQNSLYYCTVYYNYDDLLSKEAVDWFEENSEVFEENFDQERAMFRYLMAGVLCNLRQEGFWKEHGFEKLYVIPYSFWGRGRIALWRKDSNVSANGFRLSFGRNGLFGVLKIVVGRRGLNRTISIKWISIRSNLAFKDYAAENSLS